MTEPTGPSPDFPADLISRVSDRIAIEEQEAQSANRPLSSFELAKALFESGFLAVPAEAAVTEYAVEMGSGDMVIRNDEFDEERPDDFHVYLEHRRNRGIPVYRRRIVTVEDWTTVTDGQQS